MSTWDDELCGEDEELVESVELLVAEDVIEPHVDISSSDADSSESMSLVTISSCEVTVTAYLREGSGLAGCGWCGPLPSTTSGFL